MAKKKKSEEPKVVIRNPTQPPAPPPPPKKKGPPPPPPSVFQKSGETDFITNLQHEQNKLTGGKSLHPPPPSDVTHYEFVHKGEAVFITGPVRHWVEYAQKPGTMRYGKLLDDDAYRKGHKSGFRYHPDFDPERGKETEQPNLPGTEQAAATTTPKAPRQKTAGAGKREGVCGFIDNLIKEGGRSVDQILELVLEKFPGRDPAATKSTIRCRPSHIKKAMGPDYKVPPFA